MQHRSLAIRMRWDIKEGGWAPGQRLPSLDDLAEMYATSRTTVSRAVQILAHDGLLDIVPGRGMFAIGPNGDLGLRTDLPRNRIELMVLAAASRGETVRPIEVVRETAASPTTVRRAVAGLVKRGRLVRVARGKYKAP